MVVYSILIVDLSPTFHCVPKPLRVYGSMLLLSTLILSSYSVLMVTLGYDWELRMVIDISVQYNGGFLPETSSTIGGGGDVTNLSPFSEETARK